MKFSDYFSHYRETGHDRPWVAVGPVLDYRPRLSGGAVTAIRTGAYVTVGSHTFAVHRRS